MAESMDTREAEESMSNRQRKFGLPGWMVNNIERLNFVTDFEQYACSPPESEGFLAEYDMTPVNHETAEPEPKDVAPIETPRSRPPELRLDVQTPYPFGTSGLSHDEILYSSPDSTPCATPEPSPVVRRKVSIPQPHDTVLSNPGRWFYLGKLKKLDLSSNKENHIIENCPTSKNSGIKLMISNFDLNAVSPTSW